MGINCAPVVADLFYFVMRETPFFLSDNYQADNVEAFISR